MQKKSVLVLLVAGCILLTACSLTKQQTVTTGKNSYSLADQQSTEKAKNEGFTQADSQTENGLFMITQMDTQSDIITLENIKSEKTVQYAYTGGTCFYNKFKELITQDAIQTGSLVTIEISNTTNALTKLAVSDNVWEKENVSNYTVDKDNQIITINGKKYAYTDNTKYFSDNGEITLDDVSDTDVLRFFGIDKKILSIVVTTGHGTLTLQNTRDFDGGWLGLLGEKNSYYEIKDNMQLEVPEGSYKLTASNKGYGGSMDITITRNQNLDVDLSQIKGEAPKSSQVTFQAIVPNTTVYLDGNKIDISQPVEVQYGSHSIQAFAEGYDTWTRKLVVNSDSATIPIDLSAQSSEDSTESKSSSSSSATSNGTTGNTTNQATSNAASNTTGTTGSAASNTAGTTSGTTSGTSTTGTNSYLNTLSGIIDTLTNSEKSSSESQ